MRPIALLLFLLLAPALTAEDATAQASGIPQIAPQITPEAAPGAAAPTAPLPSVETPLPTAGPARDPSDDMRALIQDISTFARSRKRGFTIMVESGLPLLARPDEDDETLLIPYRTFMRALDGIVEEGLFYRLGPPRKEDVQLRLEALAKIARSNRLPILTIEHPGPKDIRTAIDKNRKAGALPMIAPNDIFNRLPDYPARPLGENGNSVADMAAVKNFAVLRDTWGYGSESDFVLEMRKNNYDLLIVDIYHGRQPLSARAVEGLKYKKLGARRLVFATMDIGHAETFRYYWQPGWREGNPSFIKENVKGELDRHYVEYWNSAWRNIMTGNARSYVYGLIAQGFDGVVIRGADAYKFFDGTLEDEEEGAR